MESTRDHEDDDAGDQEARNEEGGSFESHFRSPELAAESHLAWVLGQRLELLDALRGLFSGPRHWAQLRLWCFLALAGLPKGRIGRDDLNQLFHALQPQALEHVLKRLRDAGLLVWDVTLQDYTLSAVARQVHGLLVPLSHVSGEDDELGAILAQVAGAQALGLADASQLQHLHAQLARLHDEFAEAIASGSEARLREVQPRFERALALVDRAGQALTALIRADGDDARLEREARALGHAQARLLAMASQFTRAMQQLDRQRVTLGSTGVTSSDVRAWLGTQTALHRLLNGALAGSVRPVFISPHDMLDVAEAEFERDRPDPARSAGLPPPATAADGALDVPSLPQELHELIGLLQQWQAVPGRDAQDPSAAHQPSDQPPDHPLAEAVLGGRFAQAAYRMQLLPLLGDRQAQTLKGRTGELARSGWQAELRAEIVPVDHFAVAAMSEGRLRHPGAAGLTPESNPEHTP
ncbi:hypothetical protein D8I35_08015 [Corticibacter populi]|uniref:Uncharacterized protein n=1 Tax=Corticibacter populi TaxID=1550736 RepID=A0A3M6QTW2_9BURK|nr:hypothetical protein [Corticibacter populi]RMX06464.1 hypothetical protein D8I35_08015 [Corticibacter populi]RZS31978.1 hypothetical protein EV687_2660 [Corticibacter populi]